MEKYSVLMSLYKKENPNYLREAIESILNQTVLPDEIVIVEDGELTDELLEVLTFYQKKFPKIFNIVKNKKNLGLGLSLNNGLKNCRNELVARMDTDDISKIDRCEKQLKIFEKFPELTIVGSYIDEFQGNTTNIISTRKVPIEMKEIYNFAKRRSAFNHPVVMYKKSKVLECGGYKDLRRNQDVELFGRMLYLGYLAKNIPESLLYFRNTDDLIKRRKSWENTKSYILTIKAFWKMGYSNFSDFLIVGIVQIIMYLIPKEIQNIVYKLFLRK